MVVRRCGQSATNDHGVTGTGTETARSEADWLVGGVERGKRSWSSEEPPLAEAGPEHESSCKVFLRFDPFGQDGCPSTLGIGSNSCGDGSYLGICVSLNESEVELDDVGFHEGQQCE